MDKVAMYEDIIYKEAANKLLSYIREAEGDAGLLKSRVGDALRNNKGLPPKYLDRSEHSAFRIKDAAKEGVEAGHVNESLIKYLKGEFSPKKEEAKLLSSLDKETISKKLRRTKNRRELHEDDIADTLPNGWITKEPEQNGNPEAYRNIIHGSEKSRIKAFLQGGNASYPTNEFMPTGNKAHPVSKDGIMVHNEFQGRATGYARMAAASRMGEPAVLTGRIKNKYLYSNGGDEFSIPKQHYNKIENPKIFTENSHREQWNNNDFYEHK